MVRIFQGGRLLVDGVCIGLFGLSTLLVFLRRLGVDDLSDVTVTVNGW